MFLFTNNLPLIDCRLSFVLKIYTSIFAMTICEFLNFQTYYPCENYVGKKKKCIDRNR